MDETDQLIQIEGTVSSLIYQNPENGYTVLHLDLLNMEHVTAVGCMPGVSPGENLILSGNWTTHHAFGQQFKTQWIERRMPEGVESIYKYLAAGAIKSIGPAKARAIVDKFGKEALTIIEHEPEKLALIRGINAKSAEQIGVWFRRQVGLRRLIEFLTKYDIKPLVAMNLYKRFGDEAMNAVGENPYVMVGDFFGADFYEADHLAFQLGFEADSTQRVEAAVLFELHHNLNNGHSFLPREKLIDATIQLIDVGYDSINDALDSLCDDESIIRFPIAGQDACYLKMIHDAEKFVADRILDMTAKEFAHTGNSNHFISQIEREHSISYAEGQRRAVKLSANNLVMVLTGGPGTGKTTTVRGILALFDKLKLKTVLCAPTGRAAKRMSELSGRDATTIHRLLGASYSSIDDLLVFDKDETNPLDADAVIIDETSMVDILLMQSILAAMKPSCRLILVGDADQLPSVGPGNVFSDIIRSNIVKTVKLKEIFRQAQESRIVKNAHLINQGIIPDLSENNGDFFFLQRNAPDKAADTIVELCSSRLPKNMGIDSSQIQVLTPTRKHEVGTANLNLRLQAALNPPGPDKKEKTYGEFIYRTGDKVMQIRNNYDIMWKSPDGKHTGTGVYNGDIGMIADIDYQAETITIDYEDKLVTYLFEQLGELEPAFAMTVHKSQGSEYKAVVFVACSGAPQLLSRGILYTALTRARELLIIVGDSGIIGQMTCNDRIQRRYSGLRARLSE